MHITEKCINNLDQAVYMKRIFSIRKQQMFPELVCMCERGHFFFTSYASLSVSSW